VLIRPNQRESLTVQIARLGQWDFHNFEWNASLGRHPFERTCIRSASWQPQQRKAWSEVVEE
jgi:hypothetical protein